MNGKPLIQDFASSKVARAWSENGKQIMCAYCGRAKFHSPQPHKCRGGFRKRHLRWALVFNQKKGLEMSDDINNGGTTDYYCVPGPNPILLESLIIQYANEERTLSDVIDQIYKLFPQTLNDLIEFKGMKPWQHEVMKATYALNERAQKNGGSELREINKILYYANRGKALASR